MSLVYKNHLFLITDLTCEGLHETMIADDWIGTTYSYTVNTVNTVNTRLPGPRFINLIIHELLFNSRDLGLPVTRI